MTIFGWDVSHYDWDRGLTAAEVQAAAGAGISFVTHKIGEGDSYTDPRFDDFWRTSRSLRDRVLLGAYYVLHPGNATSQADRFVRLLDQLAPGWQAGPFIVQVDAEKFDYMPRKPNLSEIKAFVARLRAKAPAHRPVVYAPRWLYGDQLRGLDAPLWASNYGANPAQPYRTAYPGDGSSRWAAYCGQTPALLQYGSRTRIGSQSTCDANAFRGTPTELRALVYPRGDEMDLSDPVKLRTGGEVSYANPTTTVEGVLTSTNYYVLQHRNKALAELSAIRTGQAAILQAVAGASGDAILTEIKAQAEQTRAALMAQIRELAPGLAAAVVDRLDGEVTASQIGEALAAELAAMLGAAAEDTPTDQGIAS